jgi:hypothetical protein
MVGCVKAHEVVKHAPLLNLRGCYVKTHHAKLIHSFMWTAFPAYVPEQLHTQDTLAMGLPKALPEADVAF